MQEVYWYDFETKQHILCKLEEESNASLEDYEDLREETQQVNQHIRLTPIAPIWPHPPVTITNTTQGYNNPDRPPENGPPDVGLPRDDVTERHVNTYYTVMTNISK